MDNPKITVLMPVFNAEKYLQKAVESILGQTLADFEFLIFNDGSTDGSADIVKHFTDPRIHFFDSQKNYGYVYHLNEGIRLARGEYIARMDADDISYPERFARQVEFMDANPEVGVCGTWFHTIGHYESIVEYPIGNENLRVASLKYCAFSHPTVMLRKKVLLENSIYYDQSFLPAEDYYLWTILSQYCQIRNLPMVLLDYRIHEGQISKYKRSIQKKKTQLARESQIEKMLGRELSEEESLLHSVTFEPDEHELSKDLMKRAKGWSDFLLEENKLLKAYPSKTLSNLFHECLEEVELNYYSQTFIRSKSYNIFLLVKFLCSKSMPLKFFGKKQNLIFIVKCLLNWNAPNLEN
jgi:glycosyltransferase involved in cell wall biosynthesis